MDESSQGKKEYTYDLKGEDVVLRPGKKTKVLMALMTPDPDGSVVSRATLTWFEYALNREHGKTKKQAGHGEDSVEGCQACRMYDRFEDEDDVLELTDVFESVNWLMSEMANTPTGGLSA